MPELRVGDVLGRENWVNDDECNYDGYCGGEFGGSYDLKRVEAIGSDWVVARTQRGKPEFYAGDPNDLVEHVLPQGAWG